MRIMSHEDLQRRFRELVNGEPHVKALGQVITYLMTFIYNPETSAKDIAAIISSDPALATQVLTVVNSAAMGVRQQVSDLKLAVSLLGYDQIRDIVLNIAIMEKMGKTREIHMTRLWEHSFYCGKAAEIIAGALGRFKGEAFTIGLIHDIGKILICYSNSSAFSTALNNYRYLKGTHAHWESEKHVLGMSHAEVGAIACHYFRIPQVVSSVIHEHHSPSHLPATSVEGYLARVINVADMLCWIFGHPSVNTVNPYLNKPAHVCIDSGVAGSLGLEGEKLQDIAARVKREIHRSETVFEWIHARKGPADY